MLYDFGIEYNTIKKYLGKFKVTLFLDSFDETRLKVNKIKDY